MAGFEVSTEDKIGLPSLSDLFRYGPVTSGLLYAGLLITLGSGLADGLSWSNRGLWVGICLFVTGCVCYHGPRVLDLMMDRNSEDGRMRTVINRGRLGAMLALLLLLAFAGFVLFQARPPAWLARHIASAP